MRQYFKRFICLGFPGRYTGCHSLPSRWDLNRLHNNRVNNHHNDYNNYHHNHHHDGEADRRPVLHPLRPQGRARRLHAGREEVRGEAQGPSIQGNIHLGSGNFPDYVQFLVISKVTRMYRSIKARLGDSQIHLEGVSKGSFQMARQHPVPLSLLAILAIPDCRLPSLSYQHETWRKHLHPSQGKILSHLSPYKVRNSDIFIIPRVHHFQCSIQDLKILLWIIGWE